MHFGLRPLAGNYKIERLSRPMPGSRAAQLGFMHVL